ncbi:MAG: BREX system P-loop protein BrxC, partial [Thermoguttaceae bacterium]|nr:BREX system P-loop protein BrxC [Thermoguttaceae bacterium]
SSVDEVIKKRVLAKTDKARELLAAVYQNKTNDLENGFSFANSRADIKGFGGDSDFIECYPFIPYQFIILPKVFAEIRKHGNSGKHLSGGERSLLSGFLEAAQKIKDKDENALAPFYCFYDSVHTFLDGSIRRVVERCQRAAENDDGVKPEDVDVLKLLYLIRYIDDIRADVNNIAILMIDKIGSDMIALRQRVADSLKRLEAQNYVAKNDDSYMFLTDLEKDVALEIKNTPLENAEIVRAVGATIFDDIFRDKKFKYGKYDFAFNRYIDDVAYGTVSDGMSLRVLTVASDDYNASEERLAMLTSQGREAILRLSDAAPYYETLERALKIRKYVKQRDLSKFPPNIRAIVERRQFEATALEKRAKEYVERALAAADASVYVAGQRVDVKETDAKCKLIDVLTRLTKNVYHNLELVGKFVETDDEIKAILLNGEPENAPTFDGVELQSGVEGALREIERWLDLQHTKNLKVTMGEIQRRYGGIPYGWREIDVAALVARLVVRNKVVVRYAGSVVERNNQKLVDFLRKKTEIDKTTVRRRVAASETLIRQCVEFLREYLDKMDVPNDEQKLLVFAVDALNKKREEYAQLLSVEYGSAPDRYPGKTLVEKARDLTDDALGRRNDPIAFLKRLVELADDFFDASERMENVEAFFATQRPIFDEAQAFLSLLEKERGYFEADPASLKAFATVEEILASP